jgi:hypothetical protein
MAAIAAGVAVDAANGSIAALGSGHALVHKSLLDERQILRHFQSGLPVSADLGLNLGVALARIVGLFELCIELFYLGLHLDRHYVAFALVVLVLPTFDRAGQSGPGRHSYKNPMAISK